MKRLIAYSDILLMVLLFLSVRSETNAQISKGGIPWSLRATKITYFMDIPFVKLPTFDVNAFLEDDSLRSGSVKPYRVAKGFNVSYSLENSGLWETLDNGDKIWRVGIESYGAYAINVLFSEYDLPDSGEVYIFNSKVDQIIGAFTSQNRGQDGILSTMPVQSDKIIIEYYEPKNSEKHGKITIGNIGHCYRNIMLSSSNQPLETEILPDVLSCEVDINCPEGAMWQNEKRGVGRLYFQEPDGDWSLCTGTLMNNTLRNGTPYLLTANHCICTNSVAQTLVTYFNYEHSTCNNGTPPTQTISGATLVAHWVNSDFSLLQLSSTPPVCYHAYYLGWNRNSSPPSYNPAVMIHHPLGDVKKISITTSAINNSYYNFGDNTTCSPSQYFYWWKAFWSTGANELGSSGASLLDASHSVVGQLAGGNPTCNGYGCFGKFNQSWTGGNTNATQLRHWLDPVGTNPTGLNGSKLVYVSGSYVVCSTGSTFTANNLPSGYSVNWNNLSSNLHVVSTQGNLATIAANSGVSGSGWIQPIISNGSCIDTLILINVWAGIFTNPVVTGQAAVCPNSLYTYTAQTPGGYTYAYSYSWTYPSGWYNNGQIQNMLNLQTPMYNLNYGPVRVSITNQCGTSGYSGITTYPNPNCPHYFILHPNPASDNVTITMSEESPFIETSDSTMTNKAINNAITKEPIIFTIRIYNNQSVLLSTVSRSGKSFNIPLTNMYDGTYIIEVSDGKNSYRQQLIVKQN
jgi:hypothetical protein